MDRRNTITPLTATEALEIAATCDDWPPGLGFVIIRTPAAHARTTTRRGWGRLPGYPVPYGPPPVLDRGPEGARYCPVMRLHETRRDGAIERSYYSGHLDSFWSLVSALAQVWELNLPAAHLRYTETLKVDPPALAATLRAYAVKIDQDSSPDGVSNGQTP